MSNNKGFLKAVANAAGFDLDNKDKGLCIDCGKEGLKNCVSEAGKREFMISGICEVCFDKMFADNSDEWDVLEAEKINRQNKNNGEDK